MIYKSILKRCGLSIGLYFLCVIGCYCWQIKGLNFERDVWKSQDRGDYSQVEVDYYLKKFETETWKFPCILQVTSIFECWFLIFGGILD